MRASENKILMLVIPAAIMLSIAGAVGSSCGQSDQRPLIQVFYKEKEPSLKTLERVEEFLGPYESEYEIRQLVITDTTNASLMEELGLPTEHFPFAVAVDGRTSADIDGTTVIFAKFPDFMHHIGRHRGNWTLEHLEKVLKDPGLLLPENPVVTTAPGGEGEGAEKEE